jgi:iron complex outermembrane receptor protein
MKNRLNKKSILAGAISAFILSSTAYVSAADLSIEEVVIMGTKRATSQQDLGVAVTTITAKQIENTFTANVTALTELAPNVTLTKQTGFNAIAGGIRGTGNISILVTTDPSVGLTVDDFAINHIQSQFVELFDVEQIEVFRGPQGTLFGKNTTSGAINIQTKKPLRNEFSGTIQASMGQFSSNDSNSSKLSFAINVPLIDDTLSARLAVIKEETDGYYSNSKPAQGDPLAVVTANAAANPDGFPGGFKGYGLVGNGADIGGIDVLAAKLKFLWTPSENYSALLTFEHVDDNSDAPAAVNDTPTGETYAWEFFGFPGNGQAGWNDPFRTGQSDTSGAAIDIPGGHQVDVEGIYLTQTWTGDNFSIKSITGQRDSEEILASTYTGEAWTSLYDASRNSQRDMFQQELRFVSEFDGPFNFVAGAAYYEDDVDFVVFARLGMYEMFGLSNYYNTALSLQKTEQFRETTAFYLDGSFDISDKTTISAGFRNTEDKKKFHRLQFAADANPVGDTILPSGFIDPFTLPVPESNFKLDVSDSETWKADTWRFLVEHNLTDDVMLYASISNGFVSGGFAETCGSILSCKPYAPEESESMEIGMKGDFYDGRLRMNAALFSVDYDALIRSQVVTILDGNGNEFQETKIVNNGSSKAQGLELEATWLPNDNFRLDFNLGYLDHEYEEYNLFDMAGLGAPAGSAAAARKLLDLSSLEVPFSPELNYGIAATYDQSLASGASITYNLSSHYQDSYETMPFPANGQGLDASGNFILKQKANTDGQERTIVNGSITYQADDNLSLTVYGKNLTDDVHRINGNAVAALWVFTQYGAPRELGFKVAYDF